jgi:excinuclease UvrABC ATPase subunit
MKVTRQQIVTVIGFVVSSLLLILAANCSLEKPTMDETSRKQAEETLVEQQAGDGSVEQQADEEPAEEKAQEEVFVANLFCSACHYGFEEEELAFSHKLAGIGCERCHGESERHRSDEDNVTPPEIMYPKAKINPTCMMCHPRHQIRHVKHHETLLAGAETIFDPEIDGSAAETAGHEIYCTTCHARHHRIKVRTIRWNKATGELLEEQ